MIEAIAQTRVPAQKVWQAWRKVHLMDTGFVAGQKGSLRTKEGSRFSYRILSVTEGESFSILWKSLFVHMIFTHRVLQKEKGSEIIYSVRIKGLFAWPARFFLREKIRLNLQAILKSLIKELET